MKINEMNITCTGGFRALDDEEKQELDFYGGAADLCLRDPDRHIMISIACKQVNPLALLILSEKELAKQTEKVMAGVMKPYGYVFREFITKQIDGKKAEGYRCDYLAQDTEMSGMTLCLKRNKAIYYLYAYFRRSAEEESLKAVEELLDQIRWD